MKRATLLIIGAIAVFFTAAVIVGTYIFLLPQFTKNISSNNTSNTLFGWKFPVAKFPSTGSDVQLAYSDIRDPGGIPQGLPVRLQIPAIGVDSAIEDALISADGRMDVPAGSVNVAWFSLGPHPGGIGSAVIGGHFGISEGVPFVFYNLDKLKIGEKVHIIDDKNDTLTFVVRMIKSYDRNADSTPVFTSHDGLAHLNLITCEGVWNQVNGTYPQRLVVFTEAVLPKESAVVPEIPVPKESVTMPKTSTPTSSVAKPIDTATPNADVIALQTALVQKGFLEMPPGVAKGTLGTLTTSALAKYQISVGLPSTGIFDSETRAKLFPPPVVEAVTSTPIQVEPQLPTSTEAAGASEPAPGSTEKIITPDKQTTPSLFAQTLILIASLFATPLHSIITSLLLLSIMFVAIKIILLYRSRR